MNPSESEDLEPLDSEDLELIADTYRKKLSEQFLRPLQGYMHLHKLTWSQAAPPSILNPSVVSQLKSGHRLFTRNYLIRIKEFNKIPDDELTIPSKDSAHWAAEAETLIFIRRRWYDSVGEFDITAEQVRVLDFVLDFQLSNYLGMKTPIAIASKFPAIKLNFPDSGINSSDALVRLCSDWERFHCHFMDALAI